MNTLIKTKVLEDIDSLLCNLQNEDRPVSKLRHRLREEMNKPRAFAIYPHGDVAFNSLIKDLQILGYKAINNQQGISRVNYNTIGIIAGNWLAWSNEFWESIGYEVIDYTMFAKSPNKYIPRRKFS